VPSLHWACSYSGGGVGGDEVGMMMLTVDTGLKSLNWC
jgi:hypothetical protein